DCIVGRSQAHGRLRALRERHEPVELRRDRRLLREWPQRREALLERLVRIVVERQQVGVLYDEVLTRIALEVREQAGYSLVLECGRLAACNHDLAFVRELLQLDHGVADRDQQRQRNDGEAEQYEA